jgi:hypothetical protein
LESSDTSIWCHSHGVRELPHAKRVAQASLLEKEQTQLTPGPTPLIPWLRSPWWVGVPRSTEILTLSGRGLDISESDTPVNFNSQQ